MASSWGQGNWAVQIPHVIGSRLVSGPGKDQASPELCPHPLETAIIS